MGAVPVSIDLPAAMMAWAKTAGMMAKGLAKPDAAGNAVVSLSLQEGYLRLGPIRITQLPSLRW